MQETKNKPLFNVLVLRRHNALKIVNKEKKKKKKVVTSIVIYEETRTHDNESNETEPKEKLNRIVPSRSIFYNWDLQIINAWSE